jgi:DNA-binding transcriptional ArsR family regulator
MKRDMDLIRKILRKVRDHEDPYGLDGIPEIEGYSEKEISYHIGILNDAGLITANPLGEMGVEFENYFSINLTWQGQDFIDAAEDDTIWKKAKNTVIKPGASFTFDILKEWLKSEVKEKLGMA